MSPSLCNLIDQVIEQALEEDVSLRELSLVISEQYVLQDIRESGETDTGTEGS